MGCAAVRSLWYSVTGRRGKPGDGVSRSYDWAPRSPPNLLSRVATSPVASCAAPGNGDLPSSDLTSRTWDGLLAAAPSQGT